MDKNDLIKIVQGLAQELGRPPLFREFEAHVIGGQSKVRKAFGKFSDMLAAAGLDKSFVRTENSVLQEPNRKIDNSIFEKDIEKHLAEYKPKEYIAQEPWPELAVISDIHWPFHKQSVVDKFLEYIGDVKPKTVALNGDGWDMYSHTKFPRSHNIFTPREEQALSRKSNEQFWAEVKKRAPLSRCVQMLGNHCVRPLKRVMEAYPEAEDYMVDYFKKLFTFDGVETFFDAREELILSKNVILFHGYRGKLGDHRDYTHYCTVNGHSHLGGVVYRQIRGAILWELNSGYAGDPEAKGLTYTAQKITHWTSGFGIINKYGPQFVPA